MAEAGVGIKALLTWPAAPVPIRLAHVFLLDPHFASAPTTRMIRSGRQSSRHPATAAVTSGVYTGITVETLDPHTVIVKIKEPTPF